MPAGSLSVPILFSWFRLGFFPAPDPARDGGRVVVGVVSFSLVAACPLRFDFDVLRTIPAPETGVGLIILRLRNMVVTPLLPVKSALVRQTTQSANRVPAVC